MQKMYQTGDDLIFARRNSAQRESFTSCCLMMLISRLLNLDEIASEFGGKLWGVVECRRSKCMGVVLITLES